MNEGIAVQTLLSNTSASTGYWFILYESQTPVKTLSHIISNNSHNNNNSSSITISVSII